jgi:hypothetical protein
VKGLGLSRHISLWCDFAQVQCTTAHFASPPSRPPYQLPSSAHGFDGVAAASPPPTVVSGHGPRTSSMSYLILTLTISNPNFGHHHIDDNQHMATPLSPCRPAPPCHHTPSLGLSASLLYSLRHCHPLQIGSRSSAVRRRHADPGSHVGERDITVEDPRPSKSPLGPNLTLGVTH